MDDESTFYDQPVDRTPYLAFVWVVIIALGLTSVASVGVWKLGGVLRRNDWLSGTNQPGATDALLDQGSTVLDQARQAADAAANKAANDAAAAATQKLLEQKDAVIKNGTEAASSAAQGAVQSQAADIQSQFQDYLK